VWAPYPYVTFWVPREPTGVRPAAPTGVQRRGGEAGQGGHSEQALDRRSVPVPTFRVRSNMWAFISR